MGGSAWSDDSYRTAGVTRRATGASAFEYNDRVLAAQPVSARQIHPSLNPSGVARRESRDSAAHPESRGVIVGFDITGSMKTVPRVIQERLPHLMAGLMGTGFLADPQIMVAAVGDGYSDKAKLQVGQFESGNEIENDLGNLWLEGGGGGTCEESYELLLWFAANRCVMDCLERRSQKGFLFLIGDEMPYADLPASTLADVMGEGQYSNMKIADVVTAAQAKFDVYFIMPSGTSHWGDHRVESTWRRLLGPKFLKLSKPELICETISAAIGLSNGHSFDSVCEIVGTDADRLAMLRETFEPLATPAEEPAPGFAAV